MLALLFGAFSDFCKLNGLQVNVRKTKALCFGAGLGLDREFKVGSDTFDWVDSFKYLGL